MKYIVVTGGVVSGLGKGITISSLGVVLKAAGLRVTSIKIDPYLNSDAGTMSPFEHGEVFVLDDGGEADLDLGNYERFLAISLTRDHNITTGKVYHQVIKRERRGDYLGKTVQVVPHVSNAIQDWLERVAHISPDGLPGAPDVCLVEVGGTVGDIESGIFLEALRQFQFRVGPTNFALLHVSLVPVLGAVGEQKTKPTQHGVKELRSAGLSPDIIVCRSDKALLPATCNKIAQFCHVQKKCVLAVHNLSNIYHVPLLLESQGISKIIADLLQITPPHMPPALTKWEAMATEIDNYQEEVRIALVGKYTGLTDSYLSVIKALKHSCIATKRKLVLEWIEAAMLEPHTEIKDKAAYDAAWATLKAVDGVVVPGGFGDRGVDGKISAARYCRESKTPFLGICLGFQCAVIEYGRHVLGLEGGCNSAEFNANTPHPVIIFMPEISATQMGGTMRLGARTTRLFPLKSGAQSMAQKLYGGVERVDERHRHRYEVNPEYVDQFEEGGLQFVGRDDERGNRMEVVELPQDVHPYFLATQYHPEFKSFPYSPSPPFLGLIMAACGILEEGLETSLPDDSRAAKTPAKPAPEAVSSGSTPPSTPNRSPFPSPVKAQMVSMQLP